MPEFQDTMKQWRRICKAHEHCISCPLRGCSPDPYLRTDAEIATLEGTIMRWAEEHPEENPEPVYPTLAEWLRSIGLAHHRMIDPIPADIAEKLGLEPKEV